MIHISRDHSINADHHYENCADYFQAQRLLLLAAFRFLQGRRRKTKANLELHLPNGPYWQKFSEARKSTLDSLCNSKGSIKKFYLAHSQELIDFLNYFTLRRFRELLTAIPADLQAIHQNLLNHSASLTVRGELKGGFDTVVGILINYEKFKRKAGLGSSNGSKWNAYDFTDFLNVRVCPYCNRQYTLTVRNRVGGGDHICRPELDHFFSQKKYPFLKLSYYNLVPSCSICNKIKSDKEPESGSLMHPFLEGFGKNGRFVVRPRTVSSMYGVSAEYELRFIINKYDLELSDRIKQNRKIFQLKQIYYLHRREIAELIEKRRKYNGDLIDIIQSYFRRKRINKSRSELISAIFPEVLHPNAQQNKPLSKFLTDIFNELNSYEPLF